MNVTYDNQVSTLEGTSGNIVSHIISESGEPLNYTGSGTDLATGDAISQSFTATGDSIISFSTTALGYFGEVEPYIGVRVYAEATPGSGIPDVDAGILQDSDGNNAELLGYVSSFGIEDIGNNVVGDHNEVTFTFDADVPITRGERYCITIQVSGDSFGVYGRVDNAVTDEKAALTGDPSSNSNWTASSTADWNLVVLQSGNPTEITSPTTVANGESISIGNGSFPVTLSDILTVSSGGTLSFDIPTLDDVSGSGYILMKAGSTLNMTTSGFTKTIVTDTEYKLNGDKVSNPFAQ